MIAARPAQRAPAPNTRMAPEGTDQPPPGTLRVLGVRGLLGFLIALLLLMFCAGEGAARADDWKRPRLFLIVYDGLTLDDVHLGDNTNPHLANMAEHGTLGLMNCAVWMPRTDTAAMLALATGQQSPAEKTDEMAANDWEKAPGEKISAAESYRKRLGLTSVAHGPFDPRFSVKHLGIHELKLRGLDTGRLGAVLANATPPVRTWIVGNADTAGWRRRGALLTVSSAGIGSGLVALRSYDPSLPYGLTDSPSTLLDYALPSHANFNVIQMGDGARAETARPHLSESEYSEAHGKSVRLLDRLVFLLTERLKGEHADILIVSPRPPAADAGHPDAWDHLTPILGYGPDFPPGTFVSATTRTPGLIANVDVAPTILSLYHLQAPLSMIGRPMRVVTEEETGQTRLQRLAHISRIDFISWVNAVALAPVLVVLGGFSFLCCMCGLLAVRTGSRKLASVFALGLICAINFPAAQLFAPILMPPTLVEYALRIAVWMLALMAITVGLARLLRVSLPVAACLLNICAVLADLVSGQHLLKDALISNYYLPGFRYYGIGNDYLGFIIGLALAGACSLMDDKLQRQREAKKAKTDEPKESGLALRGRPRLAGPDGLPLKHPTPEHGTPGHPHFQDNAPNARYLTWAIVLFWCAITFILGWPAWGANSGSLIVTSVAFGVGWWVLRGKGIWWAGVLFTLTGIALSFGFAYLDARLHGAQSAHAGAALRAASAGRGVVYLWNIVQRKVLFNISLLSAPWTWVTASLLAGALLLAPMIGEKEIGETRERRATLARASRAVVAAAIASLIFKDSGVATVCYLVGSVLAVWFFYLLTPPAVRT